MKIDLYFRKPCTIDGIDTAYVTSPVITLSLVNRIGLDGKSAYRSAVEAGFDGSEEEWIELLSAPTDAVKNAVEAAQSAAAGVATAASAAERASAAAVNAENLAAAAAESALTAQNQIGNIVQSVSQAQETARSAVEGSLDAMAAVSALETKVESEIDLVYSTLYFELENISVGENPGGNPSNGTSYTGAVLKSGSYLPVTDFSYTCDHSIEILFTTGGDVTTQQRILSWHTNYYIEINSGYLRFNTGTPAYQMPEIQPDSTYHIVVTWNDKARSVWINGILVAITTLVIWKNTISNFALSNNGTFQGILHSCRLYNTPLAEDFVKELWNGGRPNLYSLSDDIRISGGGNCCAEYIPESLTPAGWEDSSGSGRNLASSGSAVPTTISPLPLDSYNISTERIIADIASTPQTLSIPSGYLIKRIILENDNDSILTDLSITNQSGLQNLLSLASVAAGAKVVIDPAGKGYVYQTSGNSLSITAAGNSDGGIKVCADIEWFDY